MQCDATDLSPEDPTRLPTTSLLALTLLAACTRASTWDGVRSPRAGELPALTGSDPSSWPLEAVRPRLAIAYDPHPYLRFQRVRQTPVPRELMDDYIPHYRSIPRLERRSLPDPWLLGILASLDRWSPSSSPMFDGSDELSLERLLDRDVGCLAVNGVLEWRDTLGHAGDLLADLPLPERAWNVLAYDTAVLGDELLVVWSDLAGVQVVKRLGRCGCEGRRPLESPSGWSRSERGRRAAP